MNDPISAGFSTRDLHLAAFLKAHGHEPTLSPADPEGFITFHFSDDSAGAADLASSFLTGGSVPALKFLHAQNDLRSAIRLARGGLR